HLRGALYARHVQNKVRRSQKQMRIVWDSVDCISSLFEQAAKSSTRLTSRITSYLELERTRRFEAEMVSAFDATTVVTESERQALLKLENKQGHMGRVARVCVVPNGVDTEYFAPTGEPRDEATILFSGKMSYHANITAA